MHIPLPRQVNTCSGGKQFYTCAKGPFTGCCSTDPCDTGSCPDDDNSSSSPSGSTQRTSSAALTSQSIVQHTRNPTSATASSTTTSTANLQTSASPTSQITQLSSTSIRTSTSQSSPLSLTSVQSSSTSSSTSLPVSSKSTSSSSTGPIIGAVVGGVVGALLLAALLYFCCRKRRNHFRISIRGNRELKNVKGAVGDNPDMEEIRAQDAGVGGGRGAPRDPFAEFGGYYNRIPSPNPPENHEDLARLPERSSVSTSTAPEVVDSGKEVVKLDTPALSLSSEDPSSLHRNNSVIPLIPEDDPVPHLDGTPISPKPPQLPALVIQRPIEALQPLANPELQARAELPTRPNSSAMARSPVSPITPGLADSYFSATNTEAATSSPATSTLSTPPSRYPSTKLGVMRSNLNSSSLRAKNRRTADPSKRKHVLSFMQFEPTNQSQDSLAQRSSTPEPVGDSLTSNAGLGISTGERNSWIAARPETPPTPQVPPRAPGRSVPILKSPSRAQQIANASAALDWAPRYG